MIKIIQKKEGIRGKIKELKEEIDSVSGKRQIEERAKYLLGNWSVARAFL